jgi:putative ABC transport system permease protein
MTRGKRALHDLDRQIQEHLEQETYDNLERGMVPEEARRAALRKFGSVALVREDVRAIWFPVWLDQLLQDARYGFRALHRNPGFSAVAVATLAIAIGATSAIFTAVNGLLLRAASGVAAPDRLVEISRTEADFGLNPISYPNYLDIRRRVTTLEGVYGYLPVVVPVNVTFEPDMGAESIHGTVVTNNYFTLLGVTAAAGRLFGAGDSDRPGASQIVVLSHPFWMRRFNGDPAIIGREIRMNGQPFTVIGVAGEGFQGTTVVAAEAWMPVGATPFTDSRYGSREIGWGLLGGRLKTGVSAAQAAAEVDAVGRGLARDFPVENRGAGLSVAAASPIPAGLRPLAAAFFTLLMGLVSILLLISCANVSGVLLARAAARRREIAVRLAIGAGRGRLVRQLLTEATLLFSIGAVAGLLLARVMTSLLLSVLPAFEVPLNVSLPLDGTVVAFAAGVTLVAALLSGLAPALHASKADVVAALKDEAQGPADRLRLRGAFVVVQVALSVVLVVTAGLLARALAQLGSVDRGFDPRGVESASLDLSGAGYTNVTGPLFARELLDGVRGLTGVESATLAVAMPGGSRSIPVAIPGRQSRDGGTVFTVSGNFVGPGYFATMRIPLMAGRDFTDADDRGAQPVAIVSETAARQLWPGEDAIGKQIVWSPKAGQAAASGGTAAIPSTMLVVGIARDVMADDPDRARFVYLPLLQRWTPSVTVLARAISGQRIAGSIRALVSDMEPALTVLSSGTLEEKSGPAFMRLRLAAIVSGTVGFVSMVLAALGIYGVTAYGVTRRLREFGIRLALGAQRSDIVRLVLRQGIALVAVGSAIGLALTLVSSRVLKAVVFSVSAFDSMTFAGVGALFAGVGLLACYLPVRRATRGDALEALRYE